MPAPAMVKPAKTVQPYSGMRLATRARVMRSRARDTRVSTMIPLEYASRWPRLVSGLGR